MADAPPTVAPVRVPRARVVSEHKTNDTAAPPSKASVSSVNNASSAHARIRSVNGGTGNPPPQFMMDLSSNAKPSIPSSSSTSNLSGSNIQVFVPRVSNTSTTEVTIKTATTPTANTNTTNTVALSNKVTAHHGRATSTPPTVSLSLTSNSSSAGTSKLSSIRPANSKHPVVASISLSSNNNSKSALVGDNSPRTVPATDLSVVLDLQEQKQETIQTKQSQLMAKVSARVEADLGNTALRPIQAPEALAALKRAGESNADPAVKPVVAFSLSSKTPGSASKRRKKQASLEDDDDPTLPILERRKRAAEWLQQIISKKEEPLYCPSWFTAVDTDAMLHLSDVRQHYLTLVHTFSLREQALTYIDDVKEAWAEEKNRAKARSKLNMMRYLQGKPLLPTPNGVHTRRPSHKALQSAMRANAPAPPATVSAPSSLSAALVQSANTAASTSAKFPPALTASAGLTTAASSTETSAKAIASAIQVSLVPPVSASPPPSASAATNPVSDNFAPSGTPAAVQSPDPRRGSAVSIISSLVARLPAVSAAAALYKSPLANRQLIRSPSHSRQTSGETIPASTTPVRSTSNGTSSGTTPPQTSNSFMSPVSATAPNTTIMGISPIQPASDAEPQSPFDTQSAQNLSEPTTRPAGSTLTVPSLLDVGSGDDDTQVVKIRSSKGSEGLRFFRNMDSPARASATTSPNSRAASTNTTLDQSLDTSESRPRSLSSLVMQHGPARLKIKGDESNAEEATLQINVDNSVAPATTTTAASSDFAPLLSSPRRFVEESVTSGSLEIGVNLLSRMPEYQIHRTLASFHTLLEQFPLLIKHSPKHPYKPNAFIPAPKLTHLKVQGGQLYWNWKPHKKTSNKSVQLVDIIAIKGGLSKNVPRRSQSNGINEGTLDSYCFHILSRDNAGRHSRSSSTSSVGEDVPKMPDRLYYRELNLQTDSPQHCREWMEGLQLMVMLALADALESATSDLPPEPRPSFIERSSILPTRYEDDSDEVHMHNDDSAVEEEEEIVNHTQSSAIPIEHDDESDYSDYSDVDHDS